MSKGEKLGEIIEAQLALLRWIYSPMSKILKPFILASLYGLLSYGFGYALRFIPIVEVPLNNGLYLLGLDVQFKFAELMGTIGFFTTFSVSLVVSALGASGGIGQSDHVVGDQILLKDQDVYTPQADIEELSENLTTLTFAQEKTLFKNNILDMDQLMKMEIVQIQNILRVTPTLASQIKNEAKAVMQDWMKKGML